MPRPILRQVVIAVSIALGLIAPLLPFGEWHLSILAVQGVPTVLLLAWVATESADESPRYRWGIVAAFALSLVGGFLLSQPDCFVAGVLAYLLTNIAYLTAFTSGVRFAQRLGPFAILGLGAATIMVLAWPQIPAGYRIPVLLYSATIVSMPAQATVRSLAMRRIGAAGAAIGATLLLISDSAIGVHLFYRPFFGAEFFIASTYFVGQWLIATSVGRTTGQQEASPQIERMA